MFSERWLEDFLIENIYLLGYDLELISRQYNTPFGIIDMLCKDAEGNYVIIELKVKHEKERVIAQIQRYLYYIEKELAIGKTVRGIIVAKSFDYAVLLSAKSSKYNIELRFVRGIEICNLDISKNELYELQKDEFEIDNTVERSQDIEHDPEYLEQQAKFAELCDYKVKEYKRKGRKGRRRIDLL